MIVHMKGRVIEMGTVYQGSRVRVRGDSYTETGEWEEDWSLHAKAGGR